MTKEEKMIVSAYTGILMVPVGEFRQWLDENDYIDPLMVVIPTQEGVKARFDVLKEQVKHRFLELCG